MTSSISETILTVFGKYLEGKERFEYASLTDNPVVV